MAGGASGGGVSAVEAAPSSVPLPPKKSNATLIETIILVVVSLIAVTAIVFAVMYYTRWDEAQTNLDGKIAAAEAIAREEQQSIDEANFAEREKQPNLQFTGPSDYGSLSFMYPRTWSVYVAKDASKSGDFEAYFNPVQVNAVGSSTINALRMIIYDRSIENVRTSYDNLVKSGKLTTKVFSVGDKTGDWYEGAFNNDITGAMVMFKINDKTAVIRTDANIFRSDFDALVQTITFN